MFKTLTKHSPTRGKKYFEKILIRSQVIAEIPCTANRNIVSIDLLETHASVQRAWTWRPPTTERRMKFYMYFYRE